MSRWSDAPLLAKTPPLELVLRMEELISTADTAQQRCIVGFFTLLAMSSARASDAQSSRKITLSERAIAGESLDKGKKAWTKWFCDRRGLKTDWAEAWLSQLRSENLPGDDFILLAPNMSFDAWLDRPAEYDDFRRSLHFILHVHHGMSIDNAVEFNPHSFRHFLVEAAQQLRALGECTGDQVRRLGRWSVNSHMPEAYDNAVGVSELQARKRVMDPLRLGWVPAPDGRFPVEVPSRQFPANVVSEIKVGHRASRICHLVDASGKFTKCGLWKCGSIDDPAPVAVFQSIPNHWKTCLRCGR